MVSNIITFVTNVILYVIAIQAVYYGCLEIFPVEIQTVRVGNEGSVIGAPWHKGSRAGSGHFSPCALPQPYAFDRFLRRFVFEVILPPADPDVVQFCDLQSAINNVDNFFRLWTKFPCE